MNDIKSKKLLTNVIQSNILYKLLVRTATTKNKKSEKIKKVVDKCHMK